MQRERKRRFGVNAIISQFNAFVVFGFIDAFFLVSQLCTALQVDQKMLRNDKHCHGVPWVGQWLGVLRFATHYQDKLMMYRMPAENGKGSSLISGFYQSFQSRSAAQQWTSQAGSLRIIHSLLAVPVCKRANNAREVLNNSFFFLIFFCSKRGIHAEIDAGMKCNTLITLNKR